MFELGEVVEDKISGFTGKVTSITKYLGGDVRYGVTAQNLEDGKPNEEWFDESRLRKVNK